MHGWSGLAGETRQGQPFVTSGQLCRSIMVMESRRGFLRWLTSLLNACAVGVLAVPGFRFVFARWRSAASRAEFIRICTLDALPAAGPVRMTVSAARTDGFLRYPPSGVGSVWLWHEASASMSREGGETVRCLQTICPHLGCGIDYSAARERFFCPCHASDFDREGRALTGPSPRDMDPLECRVTPMDEAGERWVEVRYVEFRTGTPARHPRS